MQRLFDLERMDSMQNHHDDNRSVVFALDIGTRSVIGLLGTYEGEKIVVQHSAMALHQSRAMFDGQIHDIQEVANIARDIKEQLEEQAGFPLREVAIAAAGRALKTYRVEIEREIDANKLIDKHLVKSIEIEGLQKAQRSLEEQGLEHNHYFCVGHTIVNTFIDGGLITNPVGHRGNRLKLDILATFLPHGVVDSLSTVMSKIGLEVNYMTLEPIAALEVAVPQNVRLLNIALVDIGAGTSDIAITKDGTVIAYGMTSTAGDEITEALAKNYLLDFDTAELLKCQLCRQSTHQFTDILGLQHELTTGEILEQIRPAIELIAKNIGDNLLQQNGKAPSAIFLIGGGSQIPFLSETLAEILAMPKERVVVRGTEIIKNLNHHNLTVLGPEGITPVGILAKALKSKAQDFIEINVNGQELKLFQSKELKVSDALVMIGYNPRDLIPKRGKPLNIMINHEKKTFYGAYGQPAEIYVNQLVSSLESPIKHGDVIIIHPAKMGVDAEITFYKLSELQDKLYVNGSSIHLYYDILLNGEPVEGNPRLKEGDDINYKKINTLGDLANYLNIELSQREAKVNQRPADHLTSLQKNDVIVFGEQREHKQNSEKEIETGNDEITVQYNGKALVLPLSGEKKALIFVDIFNHIDFDRQRVRGKLVLLHNGQPANYTDPIEEGDEIIIRWD